MSYQGQLKTKNKKQAKSQWIASTSPEAMKFHIPKPILIPIKLKIEIWLTNIFFFYLPLWDSTWNKYKFEFFK